MVDRQALADGFLLVVIALDQGLPGGIVLALDLGRIKGHTLGCLKDGHTIETLYLMAIYDYVYITHPIKILILSWSRFCIILDRQQRNIIEDAIN